MKASYLFLADGFEEIEALATVDVLRRGGVELFTVSVTDTLNVTGAHGNTVVADLTIDRLPDNPDAEWLILPGGLPGASNLAACDRLNAMLMSQAAASRHIAAICASPAVVLYPLGLLNNRRATCYPGFESQCGNALMQSEPVVVDGNLVTAAGPGLTIDFALTILEIAAGRDAADQVAAGMLYHR